jgi:hypothetical protein
MSKNKVSILVLRAEFLAPDAEAQLQALELLGYRVTRMRSDGSDTVGEDGWIGDSKVSEQLAARMRELEGEMAHSGYAQVEVTLPRRRDRPMAEPAMEAPSLEEQLFKLGWTPSDTNQAAGMGFKIARQEGGKLLVTGMPVTIELMDQVAVLAGVITRANEGVAVCVKACRLTGLPFNDKANEEDRLDQALEAVGEVAGEKGCPDPDNVTWTPEDHKRAVDEFGFSLIWPTGYSNPARIIGMANGSYAPGRNKDAERIVNDLSSQGNPLCVKAFRLAHRMEATLEPCYL